MSETKEKVGKESSTVVVKNITEELVPLSPKEMANSIDMATSLEEKKKFAAQMIRSGLVPRNLGAPDHLDDPDLKDRAIGGVIAVVEYGREMGISPWVSLHGMHIVAGRVVMGIHMYMGLALKNNIVVNVTEDWKPLHNAAKKVVTHRTTVEITRKYKGLDGMIKVFTYSKKFSEFDKNGDSKKAMYQKIPRTMLRTRCITEALRLYAADVFMGTYEHTEMLDVTGETYVVDKEGEIINN